MPTTHSLETTRPDVNPERIATRHLLVILKHAVKADAATIRSARLAVRELQRGGAPEAHPAQAGLSTLRRAARARLLVYGFVRGRAWATMEPHHSEGDAHLAYHLLRAWRSAEEAARRATGAVPSLPELLRAHLPRGSA